MLIYNYDCLFFLLRLYDARDVFPLKVPGIVPPKTSNTVGRL